MMKIRSLLSYHYPGNIRQLSNILEHAAIMADGDEIELEDLPQGVRPGGNRADRVGGREMADLPISLKEAERLAIEDALHYNGGRHKQTAEMLGISEKGLFNKIKEYHIDVP
jgi:two-component response regulator in acetoacetate metabolism